MMEGLVEAFAFALKERSEVSTQPSSIDQQVAPTQVWSRLSADLQARAIGLLAHLALKLVVASIHAEGSGKEVPHAHAPQCPQNPS